MTFLIYNKIVGSPIRTSTIMVPTGVPPTLVVHSTTTHYCSNM